MLPRKNQPDTASDDDLVSRAQVEQIVPEIDVNPLPFRIEPSTSQSELFDLAAERYEQKKKARSETPNAKQIIAEDVDDDQAIHRIVSDVEN
jgi:hypothetical protein